MDLELAEHPKCTKESPHKGRRPSAASTEGGGRLRCPPPSVDSLVGSLFRAFGLFDKLPNHENESKLIKIHKNQSKFSKIHLNQSKSIEIHRNPSKSIEIQE